MDSSTPRVRPALHAAPRSACVILCRWRASCTSLPKCARGLAPESMSRVATRSLPVACGCGDAIAVAATQLHMRVACG
jgi:hypothetical protein